MIIKIRIFFMVVFKFINIKFKLVVVFKYEELFYIINKDGS